MDEIDLGRTELGLEIARLGREDLGDAADLVTQRYRCLRAIVPELPPQYGRVETILPLLKELATANPGVIAFDGDRLVGFLVGKVLPSFRGRRAAYSPEWANTANTEDSQRIYQEMYAALSPMWMSDNCPVHLVSLLADDQAAIDAWFWEGFGLLAVDALTKTRCLGGEKTDARVRPAGLTDLDDLVRLGKCLQHHLASPPTFVGDAGRLDREAWQRQISDEKTCILVARQGGKAVAYMRMEPANPNACTIIKDKKTASVTAAYTNPDLRGRGIGTTLLKGCMEWAQSHDYERCAVDFEPMNVAGSRFWLRHYHPICFTVMRIIG